jgi:hypothetical protein
VGYMRGTVENSGQEQSPEEKFAGIAMRIAIPAHDNCKSVYPTNATGNWSKENQLYAQTKCDNCGKSFVTFPRHRTWYEKTG